MHEYLIIACYMHGAATQATPTFSHIGIQCELLLPPPITSTPTKASVGTPILSDISDVDDDIIDDEGGTVADTTQSTLYKETTSGSEPESDLSVEKQQTYLVFESALLLLFSICFMCRSIYISIEKFT